MTVVRYLADVSVIVRLAYPPVMQAMRPLLLAGMVGTCGTVDLAVYGAVRDVRDLPRLAAVHEAAFVWLPTEDADLRRAVQVQALLAAEGHRVAGWAALMVAAVAERHGVTVLHCCADFDLIGKVTGQAAEWVTS